LKRDVRQASKISSVNSESCNLLFAARASRLSFHENSNEKGTQ